MEEEEKEDVLRERMDGELLHGRVGVVTEQEKEGWWKTIRLSCTYVRN